MSLETFVAVVAVVPPLIELEKEIARIVEKAQSSPDVVRRSLLYLEVAQSAVAGLGRERQLILKDVCRCNVGDAEQVNALWDRLHSYLYVDRIRPHLVNAIQGLSVCQKVIENEAKSAWWRKHDKEAAVKTFSTTIELLQQTLSALTANFLPGSPSGMGVYTLISIYNLIDTVRRDEKLHHFQDTEIQAKNEGLGELARTAILDSSHEEWFKTMGKVESLVAELQLTFAVKVIETARNDS